MKHLFLLAATFLATTALGQIPDDAPYLNTSLSFEDRAKDLCSRLTLEEKVSLMMNTSPAIPRLGIPAFQWWNEALHGVGRNGTATVFPITMGMAASFNEPLVERVFTAVSDEARAKNTQAKAEGTQGKLYHNLSFWTPNINIFRDPRWGRGQETYGEDPYLTSRMGSCVVRGLQGPTNTRHQKLLACAKHFAVHSGPEWNRHKFDAKDVSLRDLYETYLPAFRTLVQDAGVSEVMCAYNRYEGDPCCGSDRLLHQILRHEWDYKGLVTSDCGAVDDFWQGHGHHYSKGVTEATSHAVRSGTDVECGGSYGALLDGVKAGLITEQEIDTSLLRLLEARMRLGDFDPADQVEWSRIPQSVIACESHRLLALEAARQSMVLLHNPRKLLPLQPFMKGLVIMGPNAADSTMQWGNYNGFPVSTVTIEQGIRKLAPDATLLPWTTSVDEQLASVKNAQTVIFVGGINPRLEGEEMPVDEPGFRGGDRTTIEIPQIQRDVLQALHKAGKRVVLVTCSGSALGLEPELQSTDAILHAWYGGEAGGTAVAETLFGLNNPSGKLPVTFYRNVEQLPDYENYDMEGHTYRYFRGKPLFPFGYGLSYTTFSLSKPKFNGETISATLKNTGKCKGTQVVQVYVRRVGDPEGPNPTLRHYERVELRPGEKWDVSFLPTKEMFEWWDPATNSMRPLPGQYEVWVGTSSQLSDCKKILVNYDPFKM